MMIKERNSHWGRNRDSGKENGNYHIVYGGYLGMMEGKIDTTM